MRGLDAARLFTLASIGRALAPSMEVLIATRVIQGVGAAMVEPTVLALIKRTFPKGKVGLAFGVQGVAAGVAASVGPSIGGFLTMTASWEWIFLINVPIGVLAVVGPSPSPTHPWKPSRVTSTGPEC